MLLAVCSHSCKLFTMFLIISLNTLTHALRRVQHGRRYSSNTSLRGDLLLPTGPFSTPQWQSSAIVQICSHGFCRQSSWWTRYHWFPTEPTGCPARTGTSKEASISWELRRCQGARKILVSVKSRFKKVFKEYIHMDRSLLFTSFQPNRGIFG